METKNNNLSEHNCSACRAYRKCIGFALSGAIVRCPSFGKLKNEVDVAVNKFNSLPEEYRLSREEIEQLIFETTRK